MTDLRHGETVDVTIRGLVVRWTGDDGMVTLGMIDPVRDVEVFAVYVPTDHAAVTVVRNIPADGEPQPGEVWQDQLGDRYWVTAADAGGGRERRQRVLVDDSLVDETGCVKGWLTVHRGPSGPIEREARVPLSLEEMRPTATAALTPDAELSGEQR